MSGTIQRNRLDASPSVQELGRQNIGTRLYWLCEAIDALNATRGGGHLRKDSTNVITAAVPTYTTGTSAEIIALYTYVVDLKTQFNDHCAVTAPTHLAADSTNTIGATDPSDVATSITALTEMITDFPAHAALLTSHYVADTGSVVGHPIPAVPTTHATAVTAAIALAAWFTSHIGRQIFAAAPAAAPPTLSTAGDGGV